MASSLQAEPVGKPEAIGARLSRAAWAEIDLDAITDNVQALKGFVAAQVELIAVVKANAYGHGAIPVAAAAVAAGASRLAVACVDEGVELRRAGLACPILILGDTPPSEAGRVVAHRLTPTVTSGPFARGLSRAAMAASFEQPVQVKVDTGMGRFGLLPGRALPFLKELLWLPGLSLEGVFTHFACADEVDKSSTRAQQVVFEQVLADIAQQGIRVPLRHAANTAATLDLPETHFNAVRCGIGIYGLYPSAAVRRAVPLRPALQLKARVARVQRLPRGSAIGYGASYVLDKDADIALIPIGYADGMPRALSNRGAALARGRRAPIVGRVSMDQTTLRVDGIPLRIGEEVVLLGQQAGQVIRAEELAGQADTVHYEIITRIPPRLPRVYLAAGKPVQVQTLLGKQPIEPEETKTVGCPEDA